MVDEVQNSSRPPAKERTMASPSDPDTDATGQIQERLRPTFIRQSFPAFLRCVWSILWSSFRHPLTPTVIDWSTGRIVNEGEDSAARGASEG